MAHRIRHSFTSNDGVTRFGAATKRFRPGRPNFTSNDGPTAYGGAFGYSCIWEGATDRTSNDSVTPLINALVVAGFAPVGVTKKLTGGNNTFGPKVKEAVMRYQQARGLLVDGVVGSSTWKALNRDAPNEIDDKWLLFIDKCPKGAGDYLYGTKPPEETQEPPSGDSGGGTSLPFYTPPGEEEPPAVDDKDGEKDDDKKDKLWNKPWFWPATAVVGVVTVVAVVSLWPKKRA
jgi:hypothetical protein